MEMEKFYVVPEVEVLEIEIERGFAGSVIDGDGGVEVDPGAGTGGM